MIGSIDRPFASRFASFCGILQDLIREPVVGGLNRRFFRGFVLYFRLIKILHFSKNSRPTPAITRVSWLTLAWLAWTELA